MIPGRPEQLSLDRPITTPGQLLVEGRVPEMFFRENHQVPTRLSKAFKQRCVAHNFLCQAG